MNDLPAELVARWRQGDQQAAAELWQRYAARLIALARSRLSAGMANRVDPEDVVQSTYRSFFSGARDGRFDLDHGGDLWRLLVSIMLHKLQHHVRRTRAEKRDAQRERSFDEMAGPDNLEAHAVANEPSQLEALALVDEVEQALRQLRVDQRRMFELRLQGQSLKEIAEVVGASPSTVRRTLERVKRQLRQWYEERSE